MNVEEIGRLITYIEENVRASPSAGMEFVDTRQHRSRLASRQNHVVFGRRGAGKTSLVVATYRRTDHIDVYLNLEDYKDITFPNIVVQVVRKLFQDLLKQIETAFGPFSFSLEARRLKKDVRKVISDLGQFLYEPDSEIQEISETSSTTGRAETNVEIEGVGGGIGRTREQSRSISRKLSKDKLRHLRLELPEYKSLLHRISALLGGQPIFLFLDDLYFVLKEVQPDLIDYFHRLTKGTDLYLKIATIKHRSKLYRRHDGQYLGVELGHDVFEVDMDYTLDNFEELKNFMRELLENAISKSGARLEISDMFAGEGFSQLCLASGGVPRDFLSLFVTLAGNLRADSDPIGKVAVTEAAIAMIGSKIDSMKTDSGDDDEILNLYLSRIRNEIYRNERTNAFLIAKEDLEADPHGKQAMRELVDLRLIHLIDENTSKAPSDGRRYEAYILDVGLYENSRPRQFRQIDPGERDDMSRRDNLRASPVFSLVRSAPPQISTVPSEINVPKQKSLSNNSDQLTLSFE